MDPYSLKKSNPTNLQSHADIKETVAKGYKMMVSTEINWCEEAKALESPETISAADFFYKKPSSSNLLKSSKGNGQSNLKDLASVFDMPNFESTNLGQGLPFEGQMKEAEARHSQISYASAFEFLKRLGQTRAPGEFNKENLTPLRSAGHNTTVTPNSTNMDLTLRGERDFEK